jgi:hypothetical protein
VSGLAGFELRDVSTCVEMHIGVGDRALSGPVSESASKCAVERPAEVYPYNQGNVPRKVTRSESRRAA